MGAGMSGEVCLDLPARNLFSLLPRLGLAMDRRWRVVILQRQKTIWGRGRWLVAEAITHAAGKVNASGHNLKTWVVVVRALVKSGKTV